MIFIILLNLYFLSPHIKRLIEQGYCLALSLCLAYEFCRAAPIMRNVANYRVAFIHHKPVPIPYCPFFANRFRPLRVNSRQLVLLPFFMDCRRLIICENNMNFDMRNFFRGLFQRPLCHSVERNVCSDIERQVIILRRKFNNFTFYKRIYLVWSITVSEKASTMILYLRIV